MRLRRRAAGPAPAPPSTPVLPRPVVTLLGLASAVVVLGGMRAAQNVVGPILLAFVIAIAVYPLQAWLARHLPRWLALVVTVLVTYLALTAFAAALLLSVLRFTDQIPQYQDELLALVAQGEDQLLRLGVDQAQLNDLLRQLDVGQALSLLVNLLSGLVAVLSNLVFVLALLFFVLLDAGAVRAKLAAVAVVSPGVSRSLAGFTFGVRRYLVVTAVFGAVVAALDVVLLLALGVPLPLLWGLLAFLASFVPTIGLVVGLVPPTIIGLLDGGPTVGIAVLVGYLVINNTIDNLVKPKFVGDAVGLSITMAFLSLVVWGYVLGPLGALLAIPASLLARALLSDQQVEHRWVDLLTGDHEPTEEETAELARRTADGTLEQGGRDTPGRPGPR